MATIYKTHHCGFKPLTCTVNGSNVVITSEINPQIRVEYNNIVRIIEGFDDRRKVSICVRPGVFTSHPICNDEMIPNCAILIQLDLNRFAYVCNEVFEFTISDAPIVEFDAALCTGEVPCPIAFGTSFAYFMNQKKIVPIGNLVAYKYETRATEPYDGSQHESLQLESAQRFGFMRDSEHNFEATAIIPQVLAH